MWRLRSRSLVRVYAVVVFSAIAWAAVKLPDLVNLPEPLPRPGICDGSDPDYVLGCIEFQDDGTLRRPEQVDEVLAQIKEIGTGARKSGVTARFPTRDR